MIVQGLPHACGGVSPLALGCHFRARSSPRMWGCFRKGRGYRASHKVFPTHVGVFPYVAAVAFRALRLPHACGGVSLFGLAATCSGQSSPRMWGCFYRDDPFHLRGVVFPTHVGVFPSRPQSPPAGCCLPHACGGVSTILYRSSEMRESSPRMWGCFLYLGMVAPLGCVFPTHVGVFLWAKDEVAPPIRLPHACGGVSASIDQHIAALRSSPRMWGCFCDSTCRKVYSNVFPTHVGVFHISGSSGWYADCLPHACGGVSEQEEVLHV